MATHSSILACGTLWTEESARLLCPWDFPGKNAGVGCHFLQGIFPTPPGIESGSPALQADSLPTEPQEKPFLGQRCSNSCSVRGERPAKGGMESQSQASHVQAPLQPIDPDSLQAGLRWALLPPLAPTGLCTCVRWQGRGRAGQKQRFQIVHVLISFPKKNSITRQLLSFLSRHFYFPLVPVITLCWQLHWRAAPRAQ